MAYSWGPDNLKTGDIIVSTIMEHHANMVPWQQVCKKKTGAKLELVKIDSEGRLDQSDFKEKLKVKPKGVVFTQVSNTLGTINPVKEMTKLAHKKQVQSCLWTGRRPCHI